MMTLSFYLRLILSTEMVKKKPTKHNSPETINNIKQRTGKTIIARVTTLSVQVLAKLTSIQ